MSRRRRSKARWQIVGGVGLAAIVVMALAFGFYELLAARNQHVALDPKTYCPKAGPQAVTAVVIDTTDAFNLVQRTDLANQIEKVIEAIPRYGALDIYTVGPIVAAPQPLFRKCNPGRASEISGLTGNPRMVERDWREGFREPLERTLSKIMEPGEAKTSPILESIQWVTINTLTAPGRSDIPRRLVLVSDLLQHTAGLSLYRGSIDFSAFSKTPYYRQVRAPLEGVSIDIFILRRDTKGGLQGPALTRFWTDYFDAQGARGLHLVNLAG